MTFAAYMQVALYDPVHGFYARPPIGSHGDYVTGPHVSGAFGYLLAVCLERMWAMLDRPNPFGLVELAAGDGTLAKRILSCADIAIDYIGVEVSAGARDALAAAGLNASDRLPDRKVTGCILANELLDNVPFHRLRRRGDAVVEVFVGAKDGTLLEAEAEPTSEALKELGDRVVEQEQLVSPQARQIIRDACAAMERGWVLLIDYDQHAGVRAFQGHRMHDDLYGDPGAADVTGGADFQALALDAAAHGHTVHGPISQRDFLKNMGFDDWYEQLRRARLESEERRETQTTLRLIAEQSRAPMLIDPAHLGRLQVMAIGAGTDQIPPGF